jgi:chaperonin cofactor prefoldin
VTSQLEQRKTALERRLEELRTFEREYRTRLKSYLESQLRDLDASGRAEVAPAGDMAEAQQG